MIPLQTLVSGIDRPQVHVNGIETRLPQAAGRVKKLHFFLKEGWLATLL